MKIIYNKNDVQEAIKAHLKSQGMNLEGKVVTTERVKDLIHVNIEEEGHVFNEEPEKKSILDD